MADTFHGDKSLVSSVTGAEKILVSQSNTSLNMTSDQLVAYTKTETDIADAVSKKHAAATVSGNGISITGQQISLSIGTGATNVAAGDHTHSGIYQPLATVLTNTTASFTTALESKLNGIAAGAEVNVNADWNSSSGDSQILNKPSSFTPASHNNTAHSETYLTSVSESNLSLTDVTTNNASATKHGLLPKLENTGTKYLRDDGTWQSIAGGAHTQNTDSGTTGSSFTIDSDSTTGKLLIQATQNAGEDHTMTITNAAMTADVTITLPATTGTVELTGHSHTDYVAKATYDAHTVLYATTDNTPAALTVGEQTVVGRATGGNIAAIAIDSDLSSVSANDDTIPSAKATKALADLKAPIILPSPGADHTISGHSIAFINAGESITLMDLVYLKSDGKWWKTDADAASTTAGMVAISLESKTADQAMSVALPGSVVRDDTYNWTPGAVLYFDTATAGGLTATAPTGEDDVVRVAGFALTADVIYFNPSPDYITYKV